jgi:hypothetical protein
MEIRWTFRFPWIEEDSSICRHSFLIYVIAFVNYGGKMQNMVVEKGYINSSIKNGHTMHDNPGQGDEHQTFTT